MKITKYGHACILVEKDSTKILFDPGEWSTIPDEFSVDAIFVTHEHFDHVSSELVRKVKTEKMYASEAVVVLLEKEGIQATKVSEGDTVEVKGVSVEVLGHDHDIIYGSTSPCVNHGFLVAGELYIPGDALSTVPNEVRILALPTSGPWMKLGEAIDYARTIKPEIVFPIHDALYTETIQRGMIPRMCKQFLDGTGIEFRDLANGESIEL